MSNIGTLQSDDKVVFEVLRQGIVLFQTEYKECVHSTNVLKAMSKSGHTFRINGKRVAVDRVSQLKK